ncbi:hypothetical protein [uncultured Tateyamaria sp.]|uniref:hypothetical protein n=1 Tax=uncultured Tateyamaria sp. TaxID=455651 RepID=UPI0026130FB8|nr:hypothetical protein [uncultured Tateyamaria sp.]
MALPEPRPGLVVGYDFLFREQADVGMENANKPHPSAIILVVRKELQTRVSLLAISHAPPSPTEAPYRLKLTSAECRQMGLDSGDHWVNLRDINSFDWPGYDLVPSAPGKQFVYGTMSRHTFIRIVEALKACAGRRSITRD